MTEGPALPPHSPGPLPPPPPQPRDDAAATGGAEGHAGRGQGGSERVGVVSEGRGHKGAWPPVPLVLYERR